MHGPRLGDFSEFELMYVLFKILSDTGACLKSPEEVRIRSSAGFAWTRYVLLGQVAMCSGRGCVRT